MTSDERFQANLALIGEKNPQLAATLKELPMTNMRMASAPNGMMVGQAWDTKLQGWVPLCAGDDPVAEGERDAAALYDPDKKVFVLLGMGLGYFATAFARRMKPHQRLGIFDSNPSGYKAAMYCVDMQPILGNARVDTVIGENLDQGLENFWLSLQSHEKFHIAQPMRAGFTGKLDTETYDRLLLQCVEFLRYHQVGLATWKQFGAHIGDNDLRNLPEYVTTPGLNELAGAWAGKPAICIAAGPSLQKNLYHLLTPEVRDKVAVISVGTVYGLLQTLGLKADIITTIDFQRLNWGDQFEHLPLAKETSLVYLHSTWPETPRRWPGPKYVALNSSDTVEWMKRYTEPKASAANVQTVAHLNVVTALMMGCNPIILIGQDLAMPPRGHHALGARVQDQDAEDNKESHVNAEDIYGHHIYTRHSFLSMRTVFQQMFARHPQTTFINCTEGGINIPGAANRRLTEVLAELPALQDPAGALKRDLIQRYADYRPKTRWADLRRDFDAIRADIDRMLLEAGRAEDLGKQHDEAARKLRRARKKASTTSDELAAMQTGIDGIEDEVIALQERISANPIAFGMFAVRCFRLVELLSACPPHDDVTAEQQKLRNFKRVIEVAQLLRTEAPQLKRMLSEADRRLADVDPNTVHALDLKYLSRLLARGSIGAVQSIITAGNQNGHVVPDGDVRAQARLRIKVLQLRQEYDAVIALADAWGIAEGTAARARKRLAAYERELAPVVAPYYHAGAQPVYADAGEDSEE